MAFEFPDDEMTEVEITEIERLEFPQEEANKMVRALRKKLFRNHKKIEKWVASLKAKNAINDQGAHGFTLLMHAVLTLRPQVISLLIENGADPTIPSGNGLAPVHVAAEMDKPIYLKSLLTDKKIANATNHNHSLTPLHHAVKGIRPDNVLLLLEMGAEINAKSSVGNTPLSKATAPLDFPTARLLLQHGADPYIKNNVGKRYVDSLYNWEDRGKLLTEEAQAELAKTLALISKLFPEKQLDKIEIASEVDGYPYWKPLLPIVEYCLALGCKLDGTTSDKPFFEDRDGISSCSLVGDVLARDIRGQFLLPEHFEIKVRSNIKFAIVDTKHRSHILVTSFVEFENTLKDREKRREHRKQWLEERRERKTERETKKIGPEDQ